LQAQQKQQAQQAQPRGPLLPEKARLMRQALPVLQKQPREHLLLEKA
jgi:hypothetical protein